MMSEEEESTGRRSGGIVVPDLGPPLVLSLGLPGTLEEAVAATAAKPASPAKVPTSSPAAEDAGSPEEPRGIPMFDPTAMAAAQAAGGSLPPAVGIDPPPMAQPPMSQPPMAQPPMAAAASLPAIPAAPAAFAQPAPAAELASSAPEVSTPGAVGEAEVTSSSEQPPPVHWFYQHASGGWAPFSAVDSQVLEAAHAAGNHEGTLLTDGGRCDVDVVGRKRVPAYWQGSSVVRRGTWYFGRDGDITPFAETHAAQLEQAFQAALGKRRFPARVELDNGDLVELRNPGLFVFYAGGAKATEASMPEPRIARRGYIDSVDPGEREDAVPDHLVLVLAGPAAERPTLASLNIRGAGDRKGTLVDAVDNMRYLARDLVESNFEITEESCSSGRVEFLPVMWELPQMETTAAALERLMLPDIPKLRAFLGKSTLGMHGYTTQQQAVVTAVTTAINNIMTTFSKRNPEFQGRVSIAGHGLGGVIAFDVLSNQAAAKDQAPSTTERSDAEAAPAAEPDSEGELEDALPPVTLAVPTVTSLLTELGLEEYADPLVKEDVDLDALAACTDADLKEFDISLGKRKKIMTAAKNASARAEEARAEAEADRASRLSALVQARQERRLERRRRAALAAEARAQREREGLDAVIAARTRVQYDALELQAESLFLMGAPVALFQTLRSASIDPSFQMASCRQLFNVFHPSDPHALRLEPLLDSAFAAESIPPVQIPHHQGHKRLHLELKGYLKRTGTELTKNVSSWAGTAWSSLNSALKTHMGVEVDSSASAGQTAALPIDPLPEAEKGPTTIDSRLNGGKRVDYELQKAVHEETGLNRFAFQAHSCYWTSEDVVLFIMSQIYHTTA